MSTPNCGFRSVDFSGNDPSGNSYADLVNVFPVTEYHYFHQTGNPETITGTIDLSYNYNSTKNYAVLTSIYQGYNWNGSDSNTYNPYNTSKHMKNTVITSKSSTNFKYTIKFSNGKNSNYYVIFMVIYSNNLDYPSSYPNSS